MRAQSVAQHTYDRRPCVWWQVQVEPPESTVKLAPRCLSALENKRKKELLSFALCEESTLPNRARKRNKKVLKQDTLTHFIFGKSNCCYWQINTNPFDSASCESPRVSHTDSDTIQISTASQVLRDVRIWCLNRFQPPHSR